MSDTARRCPACFVSADEDALFCDACGTRITAEAPPTAVEMARGPTPAAPAQSAEYADFWTRFAAYLVDWLLVQFAGITAMGVVGSASFAVVVFLFAPPLYFWIGNSLGGTFAKRMMGLAVVDATGNPPGLGAGFVRYIVSMISAFFAFVGYLWMIRDARRQTWHDKAAGTFVVHRRRAAVASGDVPARWAP